MNPKDTTVELTPRSNKAYMPSVRNYHQVNDGLKSVTVKVYLTFFSVWII